MTIEWGVYDTNSLYKGRDVWFEDWYWAYTNTWLDMNDLPETSLAFVLQEPFTLLEATTSLMERGV